MTTRILATMAAVALAFGLAACANQPTGTSMSSASGSGEPTRLQSRMCQVFRSSETRGEPEVMEACRRQLGEGLCTRCMASGL